MLELSLRKIKIKDSFNKLIMYKKSKKKSKSRERKVKNNAKKQNVMTENQIAN